MTCEQHIYNIDNAICRNLDESNRDNRDLTAINILSQLRNLVDHICVKIYFSRGGHQKDAYYENIKAASNMPLAGKYAFIKELYSYLQISASHYTLDPNSSERLMLKYYEYLLRLKNLMKEEFCMEILHNLYKFPLNTDEDFAVYYNAIAEKIENLDMVNILTDENKFYIQNIKPFFVNENIYYEITFTLAGESDEKSERLIAFTKQEILPFYAVNMRLASTRILIHGVYMPLMIIIDWIPSIRLCELNNFSKILNIPLSFNRTKEYYNLMFYLRDNRVTLTDIMDYSDSEFNRFIINILNGAKTRNIATLLKRSRSIIKKNSEGSNIIRYLMLRMNNKIIRSQLSVSPCTILSRLYLSRKCKPFDCLPFSFSLAGHNPMIADVIRAIPSKGHEPEFLARRLASNAEHKGMLYTPESELSCFDDIRILADKYNAQLYKGHQSSRIEEFGRHFFINGYDLIVHEIICGLKNLANKGISNYTAKVDSWLNNSGMIVDCSEKINALRNVFSNSKVVFVFGAAGTGKSTFINLLSLVFDTYSKLYLANTNPAVDNLRRKVNAPNTEFRTIASYNSRGIDNCDILFIDECSTVSNSDMVTILRRNAFRMLVLVGDMYQIESINFGNWFGICESHFRGSNVVKLERPYRTHIPELLKVWTEVRTLSNKMLEFLTREGYSHTLDESVFTPADTDEIVLCLNYSGLYGINNINRFLQTNNPNPPVKWGVKVYKINDPILFRESTRFSPFLYNNLKGRISNIEISDTRIYFTIDVDRVLTDIDLENTEIEYIGSAQDNTGTRIRIWIDQNTDIDGDDDNNQYVVVPFQIAYAVSIHKAQGLEYKSVKVVISPDVEQQITHNIFYTAITRTREQLRIYWSPETEKSVISNMKQQFNQRDYQLLKQRYKDI